jgi:hypothetical protein
MTSDLLTQPVMQDLPLVDLAAREALRRAVACLDEAEARAQPFEMSQALARVAGCYRDLHALASAEAALAAALRWARLSGSMDQVVDLLCELAETSLRRPGATLADRHAEREAARAARERARDHAFEASRLASSVADPRWEVSVLLRVSEVLEQCGDHDDAALLQTRAWRLLSDAESPATEADALPAVGRLADT